MACKQMLNIVFLNCDIEFVVCDDIFSFSERKR